MKSKDSNNKVNQIRIKTKVGSIGAIAIYIVSSILVALALYLFCILFFKILLALNQKEIILKIINMLDFKYFSIIFKLVTILIYILVFAIILKKKIIIENVSDFIQKFIIVVLTITCLGLFINLQNSKDKIYTQFLNLSTLQPTFYNLVNADKESEFYKTYYSTDFIGEFSTYKDVSYGFLEKYNNAVENHIYSVCDPLFITAIFETICMIVCVKLVNSKEEVEFINK